jgi:outer membrane lipoprotein carrier protein
MFKILLLLMILAWGVVAQETPAQRLSATEVLHKVQTTYQQLEDASALFEQTVTLKYAKIEQKFNGSFAMKKGNHYRVESNQQTIVTDGKTVWLFSPVNNQVLIDTYKENPATFSPERFLFSLPKNFQATLLPEEYSGYVLKLGPKEGTSSFVKLIRVWISDADWGIRKVEYTDLNHTRTVYVLRDLKFNSGLESSMFNFSIPTGAVIVDLRTAGKPSLQK